MKNTGAMLKAKREDSNLSLSEVALATKINPKILAAIESGEESGMPAKTILKGFVKSYALFLKMDVDEVLRSFQEETAPPVVAAAAPATTNETPFRKEVPASGQSSRRRVDEESSSGMRTVAVVVIVVLIGLIIGVRELIEKYQAEKVVEQPVELKVTPLEQAKQVEETKPVEESKPAVEKTAEEAKSAEEAKTVETSKPAEPVKVAEPAKAVEAESKPKETKPENQAAQAIKRMDVTQPPVPNLIELRNVKIDAKPAEVKPEAAAETEPAKPAETQAATVGPTPVAATIKAAKNEIILEALDSVDVKFKVKGETKKVSLGPTQVHTIRSDEPTTIDFSDGGAVNIILNGRDRGPAGDLGKPKTITIP